MAEVQVLAMVCPRCNGESPMRELARWLRVYGAEVWFETCERCGARVAVQLRLDVDGDEPARVDR